MAVPQVVIVGRPNVGKSSIFNWLSGRRLAIVDDMAGVTRDRVTCLLDEDGHFFELVDTGGIGIDDVDDLTNDVEHQVEIALEVADVVLFVVDTRSGITPLDELVARKLRYIDKPIMCVANKTDDPKYDSQADEFYRLGRGKLIRVSANQKRHRGQLMEAIIENLPEMPDEAPREPEMKLAVVGRRNAGKSTFANSLAQAERMIVSEIPGTTRDSVDIRFELDGQSFIAIDTPGVKRLKSVKRDIEFYGIDRAQRSIRRADVVLMFFDAKETIGKVDKQLCNYIHDQYKPCVLVVNKWDLFASQIPTEKWVKYIRDVFPTMWYMPIAFITGKTGKNMKALINHSQMLFKQAERRISTGKLNRIIRRALEYHTPPLFKNRRPKVYYATQVASAPPTIVLVCNNPTAFAPDYRRYLLSFLREELPFDEVPIKLYLNKRTSSDKRDEVNDGS